MHFGLGLLGCSNELLLCPENHKQTLYFHSAAVNIYRHPSAGHLAPEITHKSMHISHLRQAPQSEGPKQFGLDPALFSPKSMRSKSERGEVSKLLGINLPKAIANSR